MDISRVTSSILTERLDAEFYRPKFLVNEQELREITCVNLGEITTDIKLGYTGPTEKFYDSKGAWYLSSKNIVDGKVVVGDETDKISLLAHKGILSSTQARCGDLLISRTGTVGKCAVLYDDTTHYNFAAHLIALRIKSEIDKEYISTFLNTQFGRLQSQRLQRGTIIQGLSVYDLPAVKIPKFDSIVQTYIGNKARQAECLRERSTRLEAIISSKMQCCFCGEPKPKQTRHSRISPERLLAGRLESEFYTPSVLWAEEEIKGSQWNYQSLGDLAHRIKDGPGGWGVSTGDYVDSGVPVIRAVNLIDGECDLTDCVFISSKKHQELINHCAKQDSVLLSVRGTIGRAAVFSSTDYEEASLNAAVVTIDCKDEILPHFLAEFLNTEIGKIQTQRIANGAVQLNMNLTETGSNLIVVPPKEFQQVISDLRQKRLLMKDYSRRLAITAKSLVEALIEGDLQESELKAAQEKLRQGDNSLDREILSHLTRKGYNVSGEPPLFPDLDALYEMLKPAETSQEVE